ncbi:MAG: CHAT domain-containing protein [Chloroflexota bacterium]|nr:MAG: CHAT domain-containing protein [Chloroflexota bacterium]
MIFENFDLLIGEPACARVIACPLNCTTNATPIDLDFEALAARYERLLQRPHVPDDDLKALGQELFQAVFREDTLALFYESTGVVRSRGNAMRLRLHLESPGLANLPWELLFTRREDFLSTSASFSLCRFLPVSHPVHCLPVNLPLNILVVVSAPGGLPELDTLSEQQALHAALDMMQETNGVRLQFEFESTRGQLLSRLQSEPVHVVHFIGHGDWAEGGLVYLETDQNQPDPVGAQVLGEMFSACPSIRLVVLNACATAYEGARKGFTSVAAQLAGHGIPAVIAMHNAVEDRVAITFARHLYGALAGGETVDVALARARQQLRLERSASTAAFANPILYLHAPDGAIFEITNTLRRRLVQVAQQSVHLSETGEALAEWKELHDLLHILSQPLDTVYQLSSNPYGAAVIPSVWDQFRQMLHGRLMPFASQRMRFTGRRYEDSDGARLGEEWAVRTLDLSQSIDEAILSASLSQVRELAVQLRSLFIKHLTLSNSKMIELIGQVSALYQSTRATLEDLHAGTPAANAGLNWEAIENDLQALDLGNRRIGEWIHLHDLFDRLHVQFATIVANAAVAGSVDSVAEPWQRLRYSLVLELLDQAGKISLIGKGFVELPDGSLRGEPWAVDIKRKSDQLDAEIIQARGRDLERVRQVILDLDRLIKQHYLQVNRSIMGEMSDFNKHSVSLQARVTA